MAGPTADSERRRNVSGHSAGARGGQVVRLQRERRQRAGDERAFESHGDGPRVYRSDSCAYRSGLGFHSLASFCASAICDGVIFT
jgi:hypothetical protein